ncbi:MAG TPA: putative sulfate/molybdate transporter [Sumerlaeia bacterium]|nr:putative sulfate/molybdate transporter [Sumerlaeia bacterium]
MSGGKCQTRDEADGVGEGVRTRAGEGGLRFDRLEMGGALGDLGTFIPLLAAMVKTCALPLAPALFFAGLMNVATGFLFRIPMAVQPMKAIATVAIAEGLNVRQILAAGLATSLVLLALTLLGLVDLLNRSLPRSVVRGLQLALGLKLLTTGIRFIADTDAWWGWDSIAMGVVCAGVVLAFYFSRRVPAALVVFLLGLGAMFMATDGLLDKLHLGFAPPKFWLKEIAPGEWGVGILKGAVPQLPLTLLNSVIAVCALSCDLFPRRPAAPRRVAASVAVMNLLACPFGGMPMCHGAGGLAAQYRFGARTGGSVILLGCAKMALALLFGSSLLICLQNYPMSVLGILLLFSGLELAMVCRDQRAKTDFFVMLMTTGACLAVNSALGFAIGWAMALLLEYGVFRIEPRPEDNAL